MRQVSYTNALRYQSGCPSLLLRCIDPRFHAALEQALPQWLAEMTGSGSFASLALPGGAKALLDPAMSPVVFQALDIAVQHLGVTHVIIADHVDCRAYGGSTQHADPQAEARFHADQLRQAQAVLQEAYPRLTVVLVWQGWETIAEVEG